MFISAKDGTSECRGTSRGIPPSDTFESVESKEEAACLCKDLSEVVKRGGFRLTKWASNSPDVAEIPESDRAEVKEIGSQGSPAVRTLGVVYEPSTDTFRITAR